MVADYDPRNYDPKDYYHYGGNMEYRRVQNETKEEEEKLWKGPLGNDYNERNVKTQDYDKRSVFWNRIQAWNEIDKVLEVGCNKGYNLLHWDGRGKYKVFGVDVNYEAIRACRVMFPWINAVEGSVFDLPFKDNWFTLCFTVGVLIHVPPKELRRAMDEIVRVSGKYVLCAEYWAEEERERPFLDMVGVTWERDYGALFQDWYRLTILETGDLGLDSGFNNIRYWLMKK